MSLTATYNNTSAKVTVAIASAPANALTALIQRSPDQITWTTVRGATALPLSGSAASIDDYEFSDSVVNYYQAIYQDTTAPTYVASGTVATTTSVGSTVSVTPALPAGVVDGQTVFLMFSCTKVTAVLSAVTAGWTYIGNVGEFFLYGAPWFSGIVAPTATYTSVASGDVTVGKTFSYRNASVSPAAISPASVASSVTIPYPGSIAVGAGKGFTIAWSQSTNTSVTPTATTNDHGTGYSLLGYQAVTEPQASGNIVLTGGSAALGETLSVSLNIDGTLTTVDTGSVTPTLTSAWIKNPLRPYLNRAVNIVGVADVTRDSRTGVFPVIARTLPVAVTDLFGGRSTTLTVRCPDRTTTDDLESCLLTGETLYFQAPKGAVAPTGYFVVGVTNGSATPITRQRPANTGVARYLQLPVTEVAQPSPVIAATLSSWQTVISTYATWSAVIAAQASWTTLLQLVGSPTDVITS